MRIFLALLRCIIVVILVVYVGYFSGYCSKKIHSLVCSEVEVLVKDSSKFAFVSSHDIDVYLNENRLNPRGKTISTINLEAMEQCLKKHPAVGCAKCYYTPSGVVRIDIFQREPLFRVMGTQSYFVDNNHDKMPLFTFNAVFVPIVSGFVNDANLEQICRFVEFLNEDEFWASQVVQINILETNELELTTRIGEHQLLLGNFDGYEQRLYKMKRFYDKGIDALDWNTYKKFDLRYKDQVIGIK